MNLSNKHTTRDLIHYTPRFCYNSGFPVIQDIQEKSFTSEFNMHGKNHEKSPWSSIWLNAQIGILSNQKIHSSCRAITDCPILYFGLQNFTY